MVEVVVSPLRPDVAVLGVVGVLGSLAGDLVEAARCRVFLATSLAVDIGAGTCRGPEPVPFVAAEAADKVDAFVLPLDVLW